jgi:Uma2 family endonuclease
MATVEMLLTAEQYACLPDGGLPTELIRGRIFTLNIPYPRHGEICAKVTRIIGDFADKNERGHVLCNGSGVITEREPDTVRGADIAFYSYAKVPRGPLPPGYLLVPPDAVFEVRSPDDGWKKVLAKVSEYLNAGVPVVCVLDDDPPTIYVYAAGQRPTILEAGDDLTLPEVLPGFRAAVRRFFE